ncbi:hypothetical protein WMY93_014779 [Mugilogobius chulae]|uniref:Ig-like domain-containing protein n=1 Tax=Mugilogobius chulae TaxID=88201 RepID=A0AAW0NZS0_9GOBI
MRPALRVSPWRLQFFKYESVSLSCCPEYPVFRSTSKDTRSPCEEGWGIPRDLQCTIEALTPLDSGLYWCERDGLTSELVTINVSAHKATSTISPLPPTPSTSCTTLPTLSTAPSPSPSSRPSSANLLIPLVSSGLGLFLILLLLILWCTCSRCKQPRALTLTSDVKDDPCPEEGETDDVIYSHILHHPKRPPIRHTENLESPVYSTVKTDDVCYSSITINQTRGKRIKNRENEDCSIYSTVKTEDVCYSSVNINQTRDPVKRTKEKLPKQKDSSTYAQIRVRTK